MSRENLFVFLLERSACVWVQTRALASLSALRILRTSRSKWYKMNWKGTSARQNANTTCWLREIKSAHFNLLHLMVLSTFCKTARYHNLLRSGRQKNFAGPVLLLACAGNTTICLNSPSGGDVSRTMPFFSRALFLNSSTTYLILLFSIHSIKEAHDSTMPRIKKGIKEHASALELN